MFKSEKTYKHVLSNLDKLKKYEQYCSDCNNWWEIPILVYQKFLRPLVSAGPNASVAMTSENCSHCGTSRLVLLPGKYDTYNSKNPSVQRFTF